MNQISKFGLMLLGHLGLFFLQNFQTCKWEFSQARKDVRFGSPDIPQINAVTAAAAFYLRNLI